MGESNTVVSAYTLYRHLKQYCSHPSIYTPPYMYYKNKLYLSVKRVARWPSYFMSACRNPERVIHLYRDLISCSKLPQLQLSPNKLL